MESKTPPVPPATPFDLSRGWPAEPPRAPQEPKPEPLPWIGKRKAERR